MENTMMKDKGPPQIAPAMDAEVLLEAINRLEAAIYEFRRACSSAAEDEEEPESLRAKARDG
jgi:hypothetical protein